MNESEQADNLEMLESDEFEGQKNGEARRTGSAQAEDLPDVLYRFKALHSSETFFGYYEPAKPEWPEFHTLEQLEKSLRGASVPSQGESGAVASTAPPTCAACSACEAPCNVPDNYASTDEAGAENPKAIPPRSIVIAPTKYGRDIVEIQGPVLDTTFVNIDELVLIERPATADDIRRMEDNREKEMAAYELCRDKIWARNLPMKLVGAHYLLDEPKILFYFTADSRVDFRELVKDLVSAFKTRIELRQIGVRDEARVTGGCGVCGRVLCCHGVSDKLNPVSIKMAKDQNLSLNSLKISGPCGRLLCCLSYEYQFYKDARRELPQEGVKFVYDETQFRVVEVNALSSMVKLAGEDGRVLDMKADRFRYSEGRWKIIEEEPENGE
ncbi:MAG: hypothetical protein LLF89_04470 [Spirochaetaceae bacterium]|nr:hypothetical protein [Spirochaetaceae bacterium]